MQRQLKQSFNINFVLLGPEKMTSPDHLSIYLRQWHPSTLTLGVLKEVVLKESLVEPLKEEVRLNKLHFQESIYIKLILCNHTKCLSLTKQA